MGQTNHFLRLRLFQMAATIEIPQLQPGLEVAALKTKLQMFGWHLAEIPGWTAGQACPKRSDLRQMRRPIINVPVKNRANQCVLPDIGIKMMQQKIQSFPASDPIIKTCLWVRLIHGQDSIKG